MLEVLLMNLIKKIVLGTVQFGLDYGINNLSGQVPQVEVDAILNLAHQGGIGILDTSAVYGNSEIVLGNSLIKLEQDFKIISKYPQSTDSVETAFFNSLNHLHSEKIYGYLVHHFDFYLSHPEIWADMKDLNKRGLIEKIGFSLYTTTQLQYLLDHKVEFDILQFPYNLLDRQFEPYLSSLKQAGVEIHTRSAFLQGLFFKDVHTLTGKLLPLKKYLEMLHEYCCSNGIPMEQLSLSYVASNSHIDGVLIGVDNRQQLQANMDALQNGLRQQDIDFVSSINVSETELLNPVNWK